MKNRTKNNSVHFRLSDDDAHKFYQRVFESNLSVTTFCTKSVLNQKIISIPKDGLQNLCSIKKSLSSISNSINQIAKHCNTTHNAPHLSEIQKIRQNLDEIWQLSKLVRTENL